jgi:hypothetical protein
MFFLNLLIWVGASLLYDLVRPKPKFENARPAGLGDFKFPTAAEGRPVPILFGRAKMAGPNVVWYGNLRQVSVTERVSTGFFSSTDVITHYNYYVGIQFALCRGELHELHRVYINDNIASSPHTVDNTFTIGSPDTDNQKIGGAYGTAYIHSGSDSQAVDSYLSDQIGASDLPAYRGIAYVVFRGGLIGSSTQIFPWSFDLSRMPDPLGLVALGYQENPSEIPVRQGFLNPANVLYECLTDEEWGLGFSAALVDTSNFRDIAEVLWDEGNSFSLLIDSAIEITEIVKEIERQINGIVYFNRTAELWQIKLMREDYDVETLDEFDETNVSDLLEFTRQSWEETVNQVRVQYVDQGPSSTRWQETSALAQDTANIEIQGRVISVDLSFPGVKNAALANQIAWRELRAMSYPLSKISLHVNRAAFDKTPGDVFKFSWSRLGISEVVYRILQIDYGKFGDSKIKVHAVEDIFGVGVGVFGDSSDLEWESPEDSPEVVTDTLVLMAPRQLVVQDTYDPDQLRRILFGAINPGGGTSTIQAMIREGSSSPITTDYLFDRAHSFFMTTGTLRGDLSAYGSSADRPATDYDIEIDPESGDMEELVVEGDEVLVQNLTNLFYVDGEWIGYEILEESGDHFIASRLWRGLLNTAPKAHSLGERVWFIGGTALTQLLLAQRYTQIRLDSASITETVEGPDFEFGDDHEVQQTRYQPLPPRDPILNDEYAPSSVSLDESYPTETSRTGEDARAIKVEITPRAWRVDGVTEDDDTSLDPDYSSDSPTFTYSIVGVLDDGAISDNEHYLLRNDIIKALGTDPIPASGTIRVVSRHSYYPYGGLNAAHPTDLEVEFTTALEGIAHGGVGNTSSSAVEYNETGTYSFDIYTALPSSGTLEARINSGSWATVVSAGNTTGTLAVTSGDMVELRTTELPTADQFFSIAGPVSEVGYGVLTS